MMLILILILILSNPLCVAGLPRENVDSTLADYAAASSDSIKDPFGKVTFPVLFDSDSKEDKIYVANITPVIHYSLGGIKVGERVSA